MLINYFAVTGDIQVINILVMLMFGMDRRRRIKPVDYARCQIQLGCDRTGFQKQFVSDEIGNQKVFVFFMQFVLLYYM